MIPTRSFIIWFTPRTGSTLLCKSLEETEVAGKAGEFFNIDEKTSLLTHYNQDDYEALKRHLWLLGCSKNAVMGMKYSLYRLSFDHLSQEIAALRNLPNANNLDWNIWDDIFPNCKHIFLTRRNKVRLVVSWWKAIVDEQWHFKKGEASIRPKEFYHDKYNFDALVHLLKEHCLRESATQQFFDHNGITTKTIVYEDFIANYQSTIKSVLTYIGLDRRATIKEMFYMKTSDEISEKWIQQFRSDLQKDWDRPAW